MSQWVNDKFFNKFTFYQDLDGIEALFFFYFFNAAIEILYRVSSGPEPIWVRDPVVDSFSEFSNMLLALFTNITRYY